MAEQRRGGGGSNQRFYNETIAVGDNNISWATIIAAVVAFLLLSGSSIVTGLWSVFGFTLLLIVVIIWAAWKISRDGIWKMGTGLLAFIIAYMIVKEGVMVRLPQEITTADMTEWNKALTMMETGIQTNSPIVNQPLPSGVVTAFDTSTITNAVIEPYDTTTVTSTEPTAPYVPPTPSPIAGQEKAMWEAYTNKDGTRALLYAEQILEYDPNHVDAIVVQEQCLADQVHAQNLNNMPTTDNVEQGIGPESADPTQLSNARILMSGGAYTVTRIDKATFSTPCNEPAYFQLITGTYAGGIYETQRCILDIINGRGVSVGDILTIQ